MIEVPPCKSSASCGTNEAPVALVAMPRPIMPAKPTMRTSSQARRLRAVLVTDDATMNPGFYLAVLFAAGFFAAGFFAAAVFLATGFFAATAAAFLTVVGLAAVDFEATTFAEAGLVAST